MKKRVKVCLIASSGGHMNQLLSVSDGWRGHDVFFVTTKELLRQKLKQSGEVYIIGECNREHPLRLLKVLLRCLKIFIQERPNVIISTGAAPGLIMCVIGKVFRAKVLWIDSIANVEKLSLSGRLILPFADLFLVQWQSLADKYYKTVYIGATI